MPSWDHGNAVQRMQDHLQAHQDDSDVTYEWDCRVVSRDSRSD